MTNETAVETPVVPLCGAVENQFRETLWKYLQTEIHPDIRKQSYLGSRASCFILKTYGANSVKKRFQRGKPIKLSESDKEKIRQRIVRLVTIEKEYTEGQNRIEHYSELLAEVLKMDNVRLLFQDNKPVIEISFDNDLKVYLFQDRHIERDLEVTIKNATEARAYQKEWAEKVIETGAQVIEIRKLVPPEFYERGKDVR
jgi:hypothetical protein